MQKVNDLKTNYQLHAKKRLFERYGLNLSLHEFNLIKGNMSKAQFIAHSQGNRVVRSIDYLNKRLFFVYDRTINEIVTFLPPDDVRLKKWN